jgi:hypothetical protein
MTPISSHLWGRPRRDALQYRLQNQPPSPSLIHSTSKRRAISRHLSMRQNFGYCSCMPVAANLFRMRGNLGRGSDVALGWASWTSSIRHEDGGNHDLARVWRFGTPSHPDRRRPASQDHWGSVWSAKCQLPRAGWSGAERHVFAQPTCHASVRAYP